MKRAMAISRLTAMENDPNIKAVIEMVRTERKRKFKQTSKGAKQMARKKMKDERRTSNLKAEVEIVKDESPVTGHAAALRKSQAGS
jgi:hypothetical protein